ncbi:unnamed protein product [Ilex paraguariensis]|uniref:Uncharacterized protein n=1 Tax=Ilex paraguariensis TaxID=185542 RepID=A0ABC8R4F8_9AQUA
MSSRHLSLSLSLHIFPSTYMFFNSLTCLSLSLPSSAKQQPHLFSTPPPTTAITTANDSQCSCSGVRRSSEIDHHPPIGPTNTVEFIPINTLEFQFVPSSTIFLEAVSYFYILTHGQRA